MAEIILANLTDISGFAANTVKTTGITLSPTTPGCYYITPTAPFSLVLPAIASVASGAIFYIKDYTGVAAGTNITITATGGITIDGAASAVINTNYGAYGIISNGTNWSILTKI